MQTILSNQEKINKILKEFTTLMSASDYIRSQNDLMISYLVNDCADPQMKYERVTILLQSYETIVGLYEIIESKNND